jgi:hypothetical protein
MRQKVRFSLIAFGVWTALIVPNMAISFWIMGYDKTIRLVPIAIIGFVIGLALFWSQKSDPTRQP